MVPAFSFRRRRHRGRSRNEISSPLVGLASIITSPISTDEDTPAALVMVSTDMTSTEEVVDVERVDANQGDKQNRTATVKQLTAYNNQTLTKQPPPPPMSAYFGLGFAVVSLSALGPLLALQQHVPALHKLFWRLFGTAILLFPPALVDVHRHGLPQWSGPLGAMFLMSTLCYMVLTCGACVRAYHRIMV